MSPAQRPFNGLYVEVPDPVELVTLVEAQPEHGEGDHVPTAPPPRETVAAIRRRDQLESMTEAATREHAESLLRGIDALTRKFAMLGPVPLDVLSRYERILMAAHVDNQIRVSQFSERALLELEQ